ncbi:MAG: hypothetical protein ONB46_07120 [candidate division KSB1 bacterium]|nr:hypothetical protein [candidate division KSB1 bacterium]MDZ7368289.1 hypothetical protein [candidate division KSB1 bacterium]MDZ7406131.1 hypothetical protein [candidate division KSB1 bacterium]
MTALKTLLFTVILPGAATVNPMYVGVLTLLFGEAVFFASRQLLIYAGVVLVIFQLFVVLYHEQRR